MRVRALTVALLCFVSRSQGAMAQGFQINEHGACAVARAGAATARPCADASAIWFNPAGLAGQRGWTLSAGVTVIDAFGGFTDDFTGDATDLANAPVPVPHAYAAYGLSRRVALGVGAFVPYGLGTKWPTTFEGRFVGFDNDLRSLYLQPTVAFQLADRIAVGAGVDLAVTSVKLTQRLDISEFEVLPGVTFGSLGVPSGTDFATATLKASGAVGVGGHVGIWVEPVRRVRLGARYLTRVKVEFDGRAAFDNEPTGVVFPPQNPIALADQTGLLDPNQPLPLDLLLIASGVFEAGGPLADSTATTSITLPDQIAVGVAVDVMPTLTLHADWWWTHWSLLETLEIDFDNAATPNLVLEQNFQNTGTWRFGAEWVPAPRWTVRGGYLRHPPATPPETVTPILPEGGRNSAMAGLGVRLGERWTLDLAYMYLRQDHRRGRVRNPTPGTPTETVVDQFNRGVFRFNAHLVSATVSARFP